MVAVRAASPAASGARQLTCRDAVLDAFVRLERRHGRASQALDEVVREVLSSTDAYKESTLRTYVSSVLCADAPRHHANHSDDLRRAGRGRYARAIPWRGVAPLAGVQVVPPSDPSPTPAGSVAVTSLPPGRNDHWSWEGNVQARVVAALSSTGWSVRSVADTASKERGVDINAVRGGRSLLVEVKGYPDGSRSANTQARHHFADALLAGFLMAEVDADADLVLAFPEYVTYTNLIRRTMSQLADLGIGVMIVSADGDVREGLPPARGDVL